jgi:hypothetical protein
MDGKGTQSLYHHMRASVIHYAGMSEVHTGCFTIGVFQDAAGARKGLDALREAGFPSESLTVIAKESPDAAELVERACGAPGHHMEVATIGAVVARGPLLAVLQRDGRDLDDLGLAGTLNRAGFQAHDGRIFETLTSRGGVLVAIQSEPRAAEALALLFSYGGGNAAIGAWAGRV